MHFTKLQGAGNDYIYINGFQEEVRDPERLSIMMSNRHFGAGSDGLIIILRSSCADFKMKMYNADGSLGLMCGNGIRCAAAFAVREGIISKSEIQIETDSGIKNVIIRSGKISVDMGKPVVTPLKLPDVSYIPGAYFSIGISMGNPHFVILVDDFSIDYAKLYGERLEKSDEFPDRANIEFAYISDKNIIFMSVWERGSGITLSCGTGTCAAFAAARIKGAVEKHVYVNNPGGYLEVYEKDESVFLSGPVKFVYEGNYFL